MLKILPQVSTLHLMSGILSITFRIELTRLACETLKDNFARQP